MRLFLGFVIQPFLAAGLTYLAFPLIEYTGRPLYGGGTSSPDAAIGLAFGVGLVAALITVTCAVPTVGWLADRTTVTLRRAALYGALFGNLPVVVGTLLAPGYGLVGLLRASVTGTCLGITGAALFWVISIKGTGHVSTGCT
jgi:hypothetical protein